MPAKSDCGARAIAHFLPHTGDSIARMLEFLIFPVSSNHRCVCHSYCDSHPSSASGVVGQHGEYSWLTLSMSSSHLFAISSEAVALH